MEKDAPLCCVDGGLKVSSFNNQVPMNESDFHQNEEGTSHASSTHPFLIMPCIFGVFI
jgi:hypothetical protein